MQDGWGCTSGCTAHLILAASDLACAVFVVNVAPRAPTLVVTCTVPLLGMQPLYLAEGLRANIHFRAFVQRKNA